LRPVIGITCGYSYDDNKYQISRDYIEAVQKAGGIPVILPHLEPSNMTNLFLQAIDGLILSGGGDLDPVWFKEEPLPVSGWIDPLRDGFEIALASSALTAGVPVLGICRGMQVLNVAGGGGICQDLHTKLPKALKHSQEAPRWYPTHKIKISKDTLLHSILGATEYTVNSYHHQSINLLAPGFQVSAVASDGVQEAIEATKGELFALGVQFHPECMWQRYPETLNIFKYHIDASLRYLSNGNGRRAKEIN